MNNKVLLYNCCDDEYTHFIPIHCASALYSNSNIDIEIGVNLERLTDDEEYALNKLREMHKDCKIIVKYNFYKKIKNNGFDNAIYNNMLMWANTVRFVSEPIIKNEYTYIGDIDVVMLKKNFYNYHIDIMNKYNTSYSNWVRDNCTDCLTGLHFVKTDKFYPLKLDGINLIDVDEKILKKIQSNVCNINYKIPRRPVCGLHFSKNQVFKEQLKLNSTFINELNSYRHPFFEFINSQEYDVVKSCNTPLISDYICQFTKYYRN